MAFTTKTLDATTWDAFAELVEANNGVWGGCWCISFHLDPHGPKGQCQPYRETKRDLVCQGRAEAAPVFDGDTAVGWCQFGRTAELPNIKNRKNYEAEAGAPPDWRITCFFVGKGYRKKGVANVALAAALDMIRAEGGGVVEVYPDDVDGRKTSSSFLWGGTTKMMEAHGFTRERAIGKRTWVMRNEL